jgi:hypothetical protein
MKSANNRLWAMRQSECEPAPMPTRAGQVSAPSTTGRWSAGLSVKCAAIAASALLTGGLGCSNPAVSQLRTLTPAEAAAKAHEIYDANKDGKLDSEELKQCPALMDGMARIDSNKDKSIDRAELEARFAAHDGMSDIVGFDVVVAANRTPLVGAQVTYRPEPFMGEGKQSYVGTSGEGGLAYLTGEAVEMPLGVPTGFYKVRVVHSQSGVDATLGCEVADDSPSANRMTFDVKAGTTPIGVSGR